MMAQKMLLPHRSTEIRNINTKYDKYKDSVHIVRECNCTRVHSQRSAARQGSSLEIKTSIEREGRAFVLENLLKIFLLAPIDKLGS